MAIEVVKLYAHSGSQTMGVLEHFFQNMLVSYFSTLLPIIYIQWIIFIAILITNIF